MIDELWMGFLNSDFVITSLGEIGGQYCFLKKVEVTKLDTFSMELN